LQIALHRASVLAEKAVTPGILAQVATHHIDKDRNFPRTKDVSPQGAPEHIVNQLIELSKDFAAAFPLHLMVPHIAMRISQALF
jgi:hypothetical protein